MKGAIDWDRVDFAAELDDNVLAERLGVTPKYCRAKRVKLHPETVTRLSTEERSRRAAERYKTQKKKTKKEIKAFRRRARTNEILRKEAALLNEDEYPY